MNVAGVPFIWLSTMYCWRPISARATSPTRTMALPSWLARRMMFSYWLRLGELRLRDHRERELDRPRVRLLADLPGAEQLVLLVDRVGDVATS